MSILMMGYIGHELQQPLHSLSEHLDNARDFLCALDNGAAAQSTETTAALRTRSATLGLEPPSTTLEGPPGTPGAQSGRAEQNDADNLQGALAHVEKGRRCVELLSTVTGDITNLRNIELGRMALVVEIVDVADVIQEVRHRTALGPGRRADVIQEVRYRIAQNQGCCRRDRGRC